MIQLTFETDFNRLYLFLKYNNMILLDFIGLMLDCVQSHCVFIPHDCPVEGPNTVFSSSFLLTFPMAFLGIADRILKVEINARHIQNIALAT